MDAKEHNVVKDPEEERKKRRAIYLGQARELVETYKDLLKDTRWKSVPYSGDKRITCYEMEAGPSEGYNLKAECIIEGKSADTIAAAHRNYQAIILVLCSGE